MYKTEKNLAIALILPFFLFLILTSLESQLGQFGLTYPMAYRLKILITSVALLFCLPLVTAYFPLRFTRWTALALPLGVAATALWIGLSSLPLPIPGISGTRAAFNPWETELLTTSAQAWGFWSVRMLGLALLVPVMEELFLRGFLLRWIQSENWLTLTVGDLSVKAWGAVLIYAVATHPEILAAVVWFTLVTLYVQKTRNIWDAVLFHIGTNATLGLWVLFTGQWQLM
ncbi:MAG: CAAX prenyl protease-related protein [Planctomycetia bacterium]|nr:CAAX prenyl protease-related protein [Planctomycetia bacterium]